MVEKIGVVSAENEARKDAEKVIASMPPLVRAKADDGELETDLEEPDLSVQMSKPAADGLWIPLISFEKSSLPISVPSKLEVKI